MYNKSNLTQKQIEQLFRKCLFEQISMKVIIENKIIENSSLTKKSIIVSFIPKIRNLLFQLENNLWMMSKIKYLMIYDYESKLMFLEALYNLKEIVPLECRNQFIQLYKNSIQNTIDLIWQKQYSFVHSDKKQQIYKAFLYFFQKSNIYSKVRMLQTSPKKFQRPVENIESIFEQRDLQYVLKTFKNNMSDVMKTYYQLKKNDLGKRYKNFEQFVYQFDNLLLIGVYRLYTSYCQHHKIDCDSWSTFKQKPWHLIRLQEYSVNLLRIAIRNDPNIEDFKIVQQVFQSQNNI